MNPSATVGHSSVEVRGSVSVIERDCFYDCASLVQVELPDSIVSIGESAFRNCVALQQISLPPNLTSIGIYAFLDCRDLRQATFHSLAVDLGGATFHNTHEDFVILYPEASESFTTPLWRGYPAMPFSSPPPPAAISSITLADGGIRLTVPALAGHTIGVEISTDLQTWFDLGDFSGEGEELVFIDTDPLRTQLPRAYYRAFSRGS